MNEHLDQEGQTEETITSAPYIISVSGTDINLQDFIENEHNYRFISLALSKRDVETNENHTSTVKRLESIVETERNQHREQIINADAASDAKYNELYEQFHDMKNERDDFERKFLAATSEIESLKQQLEIANSKVEVPKLTNIDGNLAEARQKAIMAKPAIYNVIKDQANINFTANLLENDEEVTGKVVYIGKYRIADDAEVQRFRQEREEAKQNELESIPETDSPIEPVVPPAPPERFQDEDAGVSEHAIHGEVADAENAGVVEESNGTVTREEFEKLKVRVDYLFLSQGIIEGLKEAV